MGLLIDGSMEIEGRGASTAKDTSYDNTASGLQSTNVQGAIDELVANLVEIQNENKQLKLDLYGKSRDIDLTSLRRERTWIRKEGDNVYWDRSSIIGYNTYIRILDNIEDFSHIVLCGNINIGVIFLSEVPTNIVSDEIVEQYISDITTRKNVESILKIPTGTKCIAINDEVFASVCTFVTKELKILPIWQQYEEQNINLAQD